MPDRRLHVVADLHVEVGDRRGSTTLHLSGAGAGLLLDVADPAVLLRAVSGRPQLPVQVPLELVTDLPVRLRSRGRDLGSVLLRPTGRLRVRPTPAGVLVAARTGLSHGRVPYVLGAALAVALTGWLRHHHR